MILATVDPGLFAALASGVLGGGMVGALAAYRKAGPEAESIAAQTLIAVNRELRSELARRDEEISTLRERVAVLESKEARHHER